VYERVLLNECGPAAHMETQGKQSNTANEVVGGRVYSKMGSARFHFVVGKTMKSFQKKSLFLTEDCRAWHGRK